MIRKRLSFKRRKPLILRATVILSVILLTAVYFEVRIRPVVKEITEENCKSIITRALNDAVCDALEGESESSVYMSSFIESTAKVSSINANCVTLNRIKSKIALSAQKKLDETKAIKTYIPIGTLTGLEMLKGRGPSLPIESRIDGSVTADLSSDLSSSGRCGIYTVSADFKAELSIQTVRRQKTELNTSVIICQTVLAFPP